MSRLSSPSLFDLSGQTAVVTGGSRGLGLQMAEALAEAGARVVLCARREDELRRAGESLRGRGLDVATLAADLTDFERLPSLVSALLDREGRLDILVNNAGMAWAEPAETLSDERWLRVVDLNLNGLFFLTREAARQAFLPAGRGVVVNIASVGGLQGNAPDMKTVAYNASKGAVVNLTRALASEWGPRGVRVNAICPGFFRTRLSAGLLDRIGDAVLAKTPLRRLGDDEDLKGTVVYLASRASRHVTGQCIVVDGGASTTLFGDMLAGRGETASC
jgi:gluconate 5-dehydrogenase